MDVIELIIAGHRGIREKEQLFKTLVAAVESDSFFWDNALKVSVFFDTEVAGHFDLEENVLLKVMKKKLPGEKAALLDAVTEEHGPIREKLDMFAQAARGHAASPNKYSRELVTGLSADIVEKIIAHARKEDETVFPMMKEYFTQEDYLELEDVYFKYLGA